MIGHLHSEIIGVSLWPPSSPDLSPPLITLYGRFRKRNKSTSHLNIGSLKTAIEEEWDKMSGEFILKTCKSFQRHVDRIIEKKSRPYRVNLLFNVHLILKLKLILFYNRVVYYYNRIFLILLPRTIYVIRKKEKKRKRKPNYSQNNQIFLKVLNICIEQVFKTE